MPTEAPQLFPNTYLPTYMLMARAFFRSDRLFSTDCSSAASETTAMGDTAESNTDGTTR